MSDEILTLLELSSKFCTVGGPRTFDPEMVDGAFKSVCVGCEEDYLVAMAYVAE